MGKTTSVNLVKREDRWEGEGTERLQGRYCFLRCLRHRFLLPSPFNACHEGYIFLYNKEIFPEISLHKGLIQMRLLLEIQSTLVVADTLGTSFSVRICESP